MTFKTTFVSQLCVDKPNKACANNALAENVQPDLLYMRAVLVSTGQNKNDDVFLPAEMWMAKDTPVLKPVNWEHNTGYEIEDDNTKKSVVADNQIIGVMYNSYPAHKDGNKIQAEASSEAVIPENFDIVAEAAIYKYLFPKAAAKLVNDARDNKLFVSMEAWFPTYDYRLGNKIIARNEETAFLDKHLRINGGEGNYSGQKLGRVLRNFVFGGVGIVSRPANDDSVIQSFTNAELHEVEITESVIASNILGNLTDIPRKVETTMSTNDFSAEDYKSAINLLAEANQSVKNKDEKLAAAEAKIASLEATNKAISDAFTKGAAGVTEVLGKDVSSSPAEFFSNLAAAISAELDKRAKVEADLADAKAELAKSAEEKKLITRSSAIKEALGLDAEDADKLDKLVASTAVLSDEAFAGWLDSTKEIFANAAAKKDKMAEDKMAKDKKHKDKMAAQCSNADEGVTDTEVLEHIKAEASVPAGVENSTTLVSLPEQMKVLANALLSSNKRD